MKATILFFNILIVMLFFAPHWAIFIGGLILANATAFMEWHAHKHETAQATRTLVDGEKLKSTARYKRGGM